MCFHICVDGPYGVFAGRDASRGLATFSLTEVSEEYDDLSSLSSMEMESVREWEMQFTGDLVRIYLRETGSY